jgi:hypothetical protein
MGELNERLIVEAYVGGKSMNAIAKYFGTYPTSVSRILKKHKVSLRHDAKRKGTIYLSNGQILLDYARVQGRLVTRAELAALIGRKRLSPSYLAKYPELANYMNLCERQEFHNYRLELYDWLQKNKISYKPMDRTRLRVSVDALLLGKYSDIILQIKEKPYTVSTNTHKGKISKITERADKAGVKVIFLDKHDFENLDSLKEKLDTSKH